MLRIMQAGSGNYGIVGAKSINDKAIAASNAGYALNGTIAGLSRTIAVKGLMPCASGHYLWHIADRITVDSVQGPPRAIVVTIASGAYNLNGIAVGLNRTVVKNKHINFISFGVAVSLANGTI